MAGSETTNKNRRSLPAPHFEPVDLATYGASRFSLRIWHGMTFSAWRMVLAGNLQHVSPGRYGLILSVTTFSIGNSIMKFLSELIFGRRVDRTHIEPAPVFILGHWRSGTTWLHQLLACDPRFASPTGLQVFMPETFLIARFVFKKFVALFMPGKRPMDAVEVSLASVEEDEVALVISGTPGSTPGRGFAGMVTPPLPKDPVSFSEVDRQKWKSKWFGFLKKVQWVNPGKRLLLKSPEHSLRIRTILNEFPDAKFVHIVRNPYDVYLSSKKQVSALWATQGLRDRIPDDAYCGEVVLKRFRDFHEAFEPTRSQIPGENFVSIKYEDLRARPMDVMWDVYRALDLDGFGEVEPRLKNILEQQKSYQTNKFELCAHEQERIEREWGAHFTQYGYPVKSETD